MTEMLQWITTFPRELRPSHCLAGDNNVLLHRHCLAGDEDVAWLVMRVCCCIVNVPECSTPQQPLHDARTSCYITSCPLLELQKAQFIPLRLFASDQLSTAYLTNQLQPPT